MTEPMPFDSDAAYLAEEHRWLTARVARIVAERDLRTPPRRIRFQRHDQEREQMAIVRRLRDREDALRRALDARLKAHRESGGFELGLDRVCREADLSDAERLLLIALVATAVGHEYAVQVLRRISYGSRLDAEALIEVLDPRNLHDRLKYRRLFDRDSALVRAGLVRVDPPGDCRVAADFLRTDIELSFRGLAALTSDQRIADEARAAEAAGEVG